MPLRQNNAVQEYFSRRFRKLLSGDPNGIPPWLPIVAEGEEPGYFLPTDAPWVVHADFGTLVGGIRALLMQALHPGSLTGVKNHSRYESDPLGRLAGTIRWLTVTTFGSKTAVANEASRVNRLHERVKGEYIKGTGETVAYKAADKDLLLWVHIAFMESFLVSHQMYSIRAIPKGTAATGADNYIAQWSISVAPLGLEKCPMTLKELNQQISDLYQAGLLVSTPDTQKVVQFIKNPPLPLSAKPIYGLLFDAAVVSLRPEFRTLLGLKAKPLWIIQPLTRFILKFMRLAIGSESPIEDGSIARLRRIGVLS
ncbi:unannotated protein [freshwater metagenome]|uniref:Unannotated protein n=1 Tax=freshwater metagenome TaxID=449393 RepID=A0A6J6JGH7_9ZZZZ